MATITRGTTTLTPSVLAPTSLTRRSRSVVHDVIGTDEVEITGRAPGPRSGDVRAVWPTQAAAEAAAEALAVPGPPWTFTGPGQTFTAAVVGDVTLESLTDWGGTWQVTVGVQEIAP